MSSVPDIRVSVRAAEPIREDRDWVLYWMIGQRRTHWNFAFQRAVDWARRLDKPLVVLEALRCGYRWASDRLHRFALDGMRDNAARLERTGVLYFPYVEPEADHGKGLLATLASRACLVVTDDTPTFFLPHAVAAAAKQVDVRLEAVDSNGVLPLRATDRVFSTAFSFRAFLQKNLREHLALPPRADPLRGVRLPAIDRLPTTITRRWRPATSALLEGDPKALAALPIDHAVPVSPIRGGERAARGELKRFLSDRLDRYADARNDPDLEATSGLSPYLHWGHLSSHEIVHSVFSREGLDVEALPTKGGGKRSGWWGLSESAEAFLDQLVTWRELGFNMASKVDGCDRYEALPGWAKRSLEKHAGDARPAIYSMEELMEGRTADELWNAAQHQLLREGRLHNYLRMLWGKRVLEWTPNPRRALEVLLELNDRFALDGRDPNSVSGIFWVLGRYDRAWGPERPIFGKVRYMSSANTARKVKLRRYLERYGSY